MLTEIYVIKQFKTKQNKTKKKSDRNPELCTQKQIKPKFSGLEVYKRRLRRISCCFHDFFPSKYYLKQGRIKLFGAPRQ